MQVSGWKLHKLKSHHKTRYFCQARTVTQENISSLGSLIWICFWVVLNTQLIKFSTVANILFYCECFVSPPRHLLNASLWGTICFHLHKLPAGSPAVKPQPSYFMILTSDPFVHWTDADRKKELDKGVLTRTQTTKAVMCLWTAFPQCLVKHRCFFPGKK